MVYESLINNLSTSIAESKFNLILTVLT